MRRRSLPLSSVYRPASAGVFGPLQGTCDLEPLIQAQKALLSGQLQDRALHERTLALLTAAAQQAAGREPALARPPVDRNLVESAFALDVPPAPESAATAPGKRPGRLQHITWFIPAFEHPFGGVHTILRFADILRRRHGVRSLFVAYTRTHETALGLAARAASVFTEPLGEFRVLKDLEEVATLPPTDLAVATLWTSAYLALKHPRAGSRAYFVQDDESLFYASGTYQLLAAQTYRLGLYGIFNTQGLHASITHSYPMTGCWFEPTVDREVFHADRPPRTPRGPVRVIFYGRPSTDRNAFALGIASLRKFKEKLGDEVDIVCAGESWRPEDYGLSGRVRNLGVLPYEATGQLYRQCDVGLCFMFSRHPSYLPLEWMACGVAVVSNENPANHWLLQHERNCLLSAPLVDDVVEQLERVTRDAPLRAQLQRAGTERLARTSWEAEVNKVYSALCSRDGGRK